MITQKVSWRDIINGVLNLKKLQKMIQTVFIQNTNINFSTSYDLNTDEHQTSTITYRYSDECFGLNVVYNNNFFIRTLMDYICHFFPF